MKKQIGKNTLGAGNKMEVELHGYGRSTHNQSHALRTTISPGTLVPFLNQIGLAGDSWDIDLSVDIQTHPTVGPLFGSFKVQLDVFTAPIRLYNAQLHNNQLNVGMDMSKVIFPVIELITKNGRAEDNNVQIDPSTIMSYLGVRGLGHFSGTGIKAREFNAMPLITYWDIFKNYYANKQETQAYVIHTVARDIVETVTAVGADAVNLVVKWPSQTEGGVNSLPVIGVNHSAPPTEDQINDVVYLVGNPANGIQEWWTWDQIWNKWTITGNLIEFTRTETNRPFHVTIYSWDYKSNSNSPAEKPKLRGFNLTTIDDMRDIILKADKFAPVKIADAASGIPEPYSLLTNITANGNTPLQHNQEGLAVKTYQSDKYQNWMRTDWIDGPNGISAITSIDTSEGAFTIDTLNMANKVYQMLNRIAISGGSYDDWNEVQYGVNYARRATTPVYNGGLSREVVFQEVIANTATQDGSQVLGQLGGRGVLGKKNKGGKVTIKLDEASIIMGIISLTPRIDYSQGNDWDVNLKTMADLHVPAMDGIGYQDLITDQMDWRDTELTGDSGAPIFKSAGKQPAWIDYMTETNKTKGNFAIQNNEMFMTLNRRYEYDADGQYIKDLTTYIDPAKYNYIFAETGIDAMNFWVQIGMEIKTRKKMSAKIMPNL